MKVPVPITLKLILRVDKIKLTGKVDGRIKMSHQKKEYISRSKILELYPKNWGLKDQSV